MVNVIITKNSSTVSDVPTAGQLVTGELAVNTNDQKLYSKDATTVFEIAPFQTSIVGITGTMAQFDTAVTDGNIAYAGGAYHDGFSDFVTEEHIRWDLTGAGTIHTDNYIENATHTGQVTGSGVLTMVVAAITGQTDIGANLVGTDEIIVSDAGVIRRADISRFNNYFDANLNFNNYTHPNHSGHVTSVNDGAQTLVVAAITGQTDIGANLVATDEIIVSDAGVIRRADISRFNNYFNANLSFNNYTHPSHPGDDFSVDSGALSGATVISDIDINVTTDTEGHVTDANGVIATRNLTAANISALPVSNPTFTGVLTGPDFRADAYGTAATPTFATDDGSTDTGMYEESSNVLSFSSAGVRRLQLYAAVANFAPPIRTTGAPFGKTAGFTDMGGAIINMDGKEVIDADDAFLRLNQNADFSSGVFTPGALRCDGTFTCNGVSIFDLAANFSDQINTDFGIHGGYISDGTAFGATIWTIGAAWLGGTAGVNSTNSPVYGIRWLRSGHTSARSDTGEGLYIMVNGTINAAIGTSGIFTDGALRVDGNFDLNGNIVGDGASTITGIETLTIDSTGDITKASHGNYLYHQSTIYNDDQEGGITFSTGDPSGGADGDIWFKYTA